MMHLQPRSRQPCYAGVPTNAGLLKRTVLPLTRWAFYAWMFSLPFDVIVPDWLPSQLQGNLSLPRIAGVVLALCFIIDKNTRPWKLPPASLAFAAFFAIFTLSMLRSSFASVEMVLQQLQLIVLFLVCYNLFLIRKPARFALLSYAIACGVAVLLIQTGIAAGNTEIREGREFAFGADPNIYSILLAVGAIVSIGLAHFRQGLRFFYRPILWGIAAIAVIAVAMSGSRGTTLALACALSTFVIRKGSIWLRLRNLMLLAIIASGCYWVFVHSDVLVERWTLFVETGDTSHRTAIYMDAIQMVLEKPLIGWGPAATTELAIRQGSLSALRAAHNLALTILTFGGFLCFFPYLYGYIRIFWATWLARAGTEDILPMAIFVVIFVTDMTCGGLPQKLHWTFFSYLLAAGTMAKSSSSKYSDGRCLKIC